MSRKYKSKLAPVVGWLRGQTYAAPFFIGYKSGNRVERIGMSHKYVQQFFQNWLIHRKGRSGIGQHLYLGYDNMYTGPWGYTGWNNSYSIWGK